MKKKVKKICVQYIKIINKYIDPNDWDLHENADTSSQTLYHASTAVLYFLQEHTGDQNPHKPIFLPRTRELFSKGGKC